MAHGRREGLRGVAKWGLSAAVVVMVGVGAYTQDLYVRYGTSRGSGFRIMRGHVEVYWHTGAQPGGAMRLLAPGWHHDRINPFVNLEWWQGPTHHLTFTPTGTFEGVRVPLWMPAQVAGIGAGVLWWPRRGREAWACAKCGYDLAGLGKGRCPECGSASIGV